jgi:DNA-binding NtrC family response regulator
MPLASPRLRQGSAHPRSILSGNWTRLRSTCAWWASKRGLIPLSPVAHLPQELAVEDLAREVQAVLLRWSDDARLEGSPLVATAIRRDPESELSSADAVRAVIREAIERARAGASEDRALAFRALELAYLQHSASHERAAERLSVSRSTFYRLLKRAVTAVVTEIGRS